MALNEKYPVINRDKLKILIQMQISQKQGTCSQLFSSFLKPRINFEYFGKTDDAHRFCTSDTTDS